MRTLARLTLSSANIKQLCDSDVNNIQLTPSREESLRIGRLDRKVEVTNNKEDTNNSTKNVANWVTPCNIRQVFDGAALRFPDITEAEMKNHDEEPGLEFCGDGDSFFFFFLVEQNPADNKNKRWNFLRHLLITPMTLDNQPKTIPLSTKMVTRAIAAKTTLMAKEMIGTPRELV